MNIKCSLMWKKAQSSSVLIYLFILKIFSPASSLENKQRITGPQASLGPLDARGSLERP